MKTALIQPGMRLLLVVLLEVMARFLLVLGRNSPTLEHPGVHKAATKTYAEYSWHSLAHFKPF